MERLKFWLIVLGVPIIILAIAIEVGPFPKVLVQATTTVGCIACVFAVKELIVLIKSSNEEAKKRFGAKIIPYRCNLEEKEKRENDNGYE